MMIFTKPSIPYQIESIKNVDVILYEPGKNINPFTKNKNDILFADDTASGRPCKTIEEQIETNVYPYYSNTHSNASCGTMMKELVKKTKDIIRKTMNVTENQKIIFSGNGSTSAINHLVNKIDFSQYKKICIHTSLFEHHSNFLPWKEKLADHVKAYPNTIIEYNYMESDENLNIMIDNYLLKFDSSLTILEARLDIFALTACSNVTGKKYYLDYKNLWDYIKKKKALGHQMYLLLDYACCAPYINIDCTTCDGLYFSGHKFLGGPGTPGVLIINSELLQIKHPYQPGGGCVDEANDKRILYKTEWENRELCGTPNICGIIKLGYVLFLKESLINTIQTNEKIIVGYVTEKLQDLETKYDSFKVIGLFGRNQEDLPIYPITIQGLHFNMITCMLNDLFGIQTRGGYSCCGTFGRFCKEKFGYDGWCRVSFNYLHLPKDVNKILDTIEYIIVNKETLKKLYKYDENSDMFYYIDKSE